MVPSEYRFDYRPTAADLRRFALSNIIRKSWNRGFSSFLAASFLSYFVRMYFHHASIAIPATVVIFVISTLAVVVVAFDSAGKAAANDHSIVMAPDGFLMVSGGVREFVGWPSVKTINSNSGDFCVVSNMMVGYSVPRSAFREPNQAYGMVQYANALRAGPMMFPADGGAQPSQQPGAGEIWPPPPMR